MTGNEYQEKALRTEARIVKDTVPYTRLIEALMGLSGETGEAIDALKKVLFQGHDFDRVRIARELGDIAWYLALAADAIGCGLEDIFKMNIEKLEKRYPNGFEKERSVRRRKGDI